jgi:hypothetical protein
MRAWHIILPISPICIPARGGDADDDTTVGTGAAGGDGGATVGSGGTATGGTTTGGTTMAARRQAARRWRHDDRRHDKQRNDRCWRRIHDCRWDGRCQWSREYRRMGHRRCRSVRLVFCRMTLRGPRAQPIVAMRRTPNVVTDGVARSMAADTVWIQEQEPECIRVDRLARSCVKRDR